MLKNAGMQQEECLKKKMQVHAEYCLVFKSLMQKLNFEYRTVLILLFTSSNSAVSGKSRRSEF